MGLYNLALSTIVLFASFSDLGVGSALVTYVSRLLGKGDKEKAKGYAKKLFRWKIILVLIAGGILILTAYFIATYYYKKPIFYALLAGGIYIPVVSLITFVETMFKSEEKFRVPLNKEIIFQIVRLIIVPLTILLFLKTGMSNRGVVVMTILALIASYAIALLYLVIRARKKINFLQVSSKDIDIKEKKDLKKFIYPLSATALAGMFFGYVDILMLGHYVQESFIAYYGAALSLVGSAATIISFMSTALMPIFARKTGKALEDIFRKTRNFTFVLSLIAGIFTYFVAWYVIRLTYGLDYLQSVPILKVFSIMMVILPVAGLYVSYFTTQKKTKDLAYLLVGSAIINIILNFVGITYGLNHYGALGAVYGAMIATIISRIFYLAGLGIRRKK
jgi:O-antigen/teichoic acid export membrane protein